MHKILCDLVLAVRIVFN